MRISMIRKTSMHQDLATDKVIWWRKHCQVKLSLDLRNKWSRKIRGRVTLMTSSKRCLIVKVKLTFSRVRNLSTFKTSNQLWIRGASTPSIRSKTLHLYHLMSLLVSQGVSILICHLLRKTGKILTLNMFPLMSGLLATTQFRLTSAGNFLSTSQRENREVSKG